MADGFRLIIELFDNFSLSNNFLIKTAFCRALARKMRGLVRQLTELSNKSNIPGVDILIGMDIITMGDFVITNADGKTLFSFVIPTLNNKISFSKMINK